MAFPLVVTPEAEEDLAHARRWYEQRGRGLGDRFLASIEEVFDRIRRVPEAHAVTYRSIRQALSRRFPYVVCYTFEADCVHVIAVFHGHRDPDEWKSRAP